MSKLPIFFLLPLKTSCSPSLLQDFESFVVGLDNTILYELRDGFLPKVDCLILN